MCSGIARRGELRHNGAASFIRRAGVHMEDLEVVWPLHKWHYLSPDLIDRRLDMPANVTAVAPEPSATGRDLAARALLAGAHCTQERVAELLETSRRSIARTIDADLRAAPTMRRWSRPHEPCSPTMRVAVPRPRNARRLTRGSSARDATGHRGSRRPCGDVVVRRNGRR